MKKKKKKKRVVPRNPWAQGMVLHTGGHAGPHKNTERSVRKGSSRKAKHRARELSFYPPIAA